MIITIGDELVYCLRIILEESHDSTHIIYIPKTHAITEEAIGRTRYGQPYTNGAPQE